MVFFFLIWKGPLEMSFWVILTILFRMVWNGNVFLDQTFERNRFEVKIMGF